MSRKFAFNPVYQRRDDSIFLQCAVPACNRNTNNSPYKIFVKVPYRPRVRWDWFKRAKIKVYTSFHTDVYFCDDHFEENIRFNDVAVTNISPPTKFECQYFMDSDDDGPSNDMDIGHGIGIQEETIKSSDPENTYCIPEEILQETSFSPEVQPTSANETLTSTMNWSSILKTYSSPSKKIFRRIKFKTWEDVEKTFFTYFAILDHDYARGLLSGFEINRRIKIAKRSIAKLENIMKYNNLSVSLLKKNKIQKQNNATRVRVSDTDSASRVATYKCRYCASKYLHRHDLLNHVEERHLDIRHELIFNKKVNENTDKKQKFIKKVSEDTDSAESIETYKCDYCDIEYICETDLLSHVEQHLGMNQEEEEGEETLDIKPEIFQCNKCPASFINEVGMSNHLQIMHGDVIDKYIQSIKSSQNNGCKSKDNYDFTYSVYAEKDYETTNNDEQQNSKSLDSFLGYNFTELRTENEIKKEFSDPLEDVDLPMDDENFVQNLRLNLYDQDDFSGSHSNININIHGTIVGPGNDLSPGNVHQNDINMMPEPNAFTKNQDYDLSRANNPNVIKCKCCKISFSNQEELLDHIHELINTKSKWCANVKFKKPESVCDDTDSSVIFDKPEEERESSSIIGHSSNTKPNKSKPNCILCSRKIRNLAAAKRRICVICQRSGKNNDNPPENMKARLNKLISAKAKLCTNAKPVMQVNSVQFNKPESVCDDDTNSSFMDKAKSIDNTQLVYDKPEEDRENPSITEHSSNSKPKKSNSKCIHCSRWLRNAAAGKRRMCFKCQKFGKGEKPTCILCSRRIKNPAAANIRICVICQRMYRINHRKSMKALIQLEKIMVVKNDTPQEKNKLKNAPIEKITEEKNYTPENKSKSGLTDEQILENMHKFLVKTQINISHARNEERKSIPVGSDLLKPLTKEELENLQRSITESQKKHSYIKIDELTAPVDNDLLKPLRIEDEKILVQPRDPTVCKYCLKPLEITVKSGQNNASCDKCQSIETSNEVRRKSNEERRKSNLIRKISYDKVDTRCCVKLERIKIHGCHICRSKFINKLDLREHVARSHL